MGNEARIQSALTQLQRLKEQRGNYYTNQEELEREIAELEMLLNYLTE